MLMLIGRMAECDKVRLLNFNTSHVNVNQSNVLGADSSSKFQYISC